MGATAQRCDSERIHIWKDHEAFFMMKLTVKYIDPFIAENLAPEMNDVWKSCTNYIDRIPSFEGREMEGNIESLCVGVSLIYLSIRDKEIDESKMKERVEIILGERKSWGSYSPLACIEMVIRNLQIDNVNPGSGNIS